MERLPGDVQRTIFQYTPRESRFLSKGISRTTDRAFYERLCKSNITVKELQIYLDKKPYLFLDWKQEGAEEFEEQLYQSVFRSYARMPGEYYNEEILISLDIPEKQIYYNMNWYNRTRKIVNTFVSPITHVPLIDILSANNIYKQRKNCQKIGLSLGKSYLNDITLKYFLNAKETLLNATPIPELDLCTYHCYLKFNCDFLLLKELTSYPIITIPFDTLQIDNKTNEVLAYSFTDEGLQKLDNIKKEVNELETLIMNELTL